MVADNQRAFLTSQVSKEHRQLIDFQCVDGIDDIGMGGDARQHIDCVVTAILFDGNRCCLGQRLVVAIDSGLDNREDNTIGINGCRYRADGGIDEHIVIRLQANELRAIESILHREAGTGDEDIAAAEEVNRLRGNQALTTGAER